MIYFNLELKQIAGHDFTVSNDRKSECSLSNKMTLNLCVNVTTCIKFSRILSDCGILTESCIWNFVTSIYILSSVNSSLMKTFQ